MYKDLSEQAGDTELRVTFAGSSNAKSLAPSMAQASALQGSAACQSYSACPNLELEYWSFLLVRRLNLVAAA